MLGRRGQPTNLRWSHRRNTLNLAKAPGGVVRCVGTVEQSIVHSPPARCRPEFRIGERVLARWSDRRLYPACISAVLDFGRSYRVDFDDGFTKVLPPGSIRRLEKSHAAYSKPLGRRFRSRESGGSLTESTETPDARSLRLARRKQVGNSSPPNGSTETSFESRSIPSAVRRIGILSASLSADTLVTSSALSPVTERDRSMGSCADELRGECSSLGDSSNERTSVVEDEDCERHHSAPVSVQTSPVLGDDARSSVNGVHLPEEERKKLLDKRTKVPLTTLNGRRGQTLGEAATSCSTASSSPGSSDSALTPLCNGNGSHSTEHVLGQGHALDSSTVCPLSGELQPVLFPQIPELPPLSPHDSPLRNRPCLTDAETSSTTASGMLFEDMDRPQPTPAESNGGSPLRKPPSSSPGLHGVRRTNSPQFSCHRPGSDSEIPIQPRRRKRKKIADAVLQPPPRIIAPKEVIPIADHNLFKCTVADCDKSFRKLNRLEYHIKYYHPKCKRELEAVIRQQDPSRKGTSSRREVGRPLEMMRRNAASSAARLREQRRPTLSGRRKEGSESHSRVVRKPASVPSLSRTNSQEDSSLSGFAKGKGSSEAGGDLSDPDGRPKQALKRKRPSLEEHDEVRCAKRPRTLIPDEKHESARRQAEPTAAGVRPDGRACKTMLSRRSLSFSDDVQLSPQPVMGKLCGVRKLRRKGDTGGSDGLRTFSQLPPTAVICCPCREGNQGDWLVQCTNCRCYQHLACVMFTSLATYCCPGCMRPSGLRKGARFKYASTWHRKSTLPWANLTHQRTHLDSQASGLMREADELSWKMLVQSLSLAHDVGKELTAVQEVLQLTCILMHHLQTNSIEDVPRDFLLFHVKSEPTIKQEPADSVPDTHKADLDSCEDTKVTCLPEMPVHPETVARPAGTETPSLLPVPLSSSEVFDPSLADADKPLQWTPSPHLPSPSARSMTGSPGKHTPLQQDINPPSTSHAQINQSTSQSCTSPTTQHVTFSHSSITEPPTSPSSLNPPALSENLSILASQPATLAVVPQVKQLHALNDLNPTDSLSRVDAPSPVAKSPVTLLPAEAPVASEPSDSGRCVHGKTELHPSNAALELNSLARKEACLSPMNCSSEESTAGQQQSTTLNVNSSSNDTSTGKLEKNDPRPTDHHSLQLSQPKQQDDGAPQRPTAAEREAAEKERAQIQASILLFVEEKHTAAKAQLSHLERVMTLLEDMESADGAPDSSLLPSLSGQSSLISATLSELRRLREALRL